MDTQNAGGMDVYIQAHDAAYNATMGRAAMTARTTARQISAAFNGATLDQFGHRADVIFTGLGNRFRLLARDLRSFTAQLSVVSGIGGYMSVRAFIDTAGDFEQRMEIIKALSESTSGEMRGLEEQTISLGSSTARTAGEIAQGALELQKMGRSISEIQTILPSVTDFSIAADQSVAQAANTAGSVMMQFRMNAGDTERIMDALTRGANQSAADVGDFSIALSYAGQQAFNANVSLERTIALMRIASNAGIPGSRLGTGLQSVLNDIYMPNMRQHRMFRQLGIETREATGELRDLYAVLQDIFDKIPQNRWNLFEVDTQNYLMALRGQGVDAIRAAENDQISRQAGEAARTAEARMRGLKGALDALGGAFDALMIKAGEAGVTGLLTRFFRQMGEWVASLSQASTQTIMFGAALAGLALALGPVMFLLGALLALITSPEGLIFAFVALAAAGSTWVRLSSEIEGVRDAMTRMAEPTANIARLTREIAEASGAAADALRNQRTEQLNNLFMEARLARVRAEAAENDPALVRARERQEGWGGFGQTMGDLGQTFNALTSEEETPFERAIRLRADAERMREAANEAQLDITRSRGAQPTPRGAATPPLLAGDMSAMMGMMSASAQIERQTALLEAQARAAGESVQAMQRLAAIQAIIEQSRDGMGGQMSEAAATAIYERQRAAQGIIAHAMHEEEAAAAIRNTGKALAGLRVQQSRTMIDQQALTEAMQAGTHAYDVAALSLDLLANNYGLTRAEAEAMAERITTSNDQFARAQEAMQRYATAFKDIGDSIAGAFERAVLEGGSLSETLQQLARDILTIALRAAIIQPLGNWLGDAISGLFGMGNSAPMGLPGKAHGGNVWPGAAVEVGEQGRELFVPKVGGTIISAAGLSAMGGGGGINYVDRRSYDLRGASVDAVQRLERLRAQDRAELPGMIRATVGDMRQRGRLGF